MTCGIEILALGFSLVSLGTIIFFLWLDKKLKNIDEIGLFKSKPHVWDRKLRFTDYIMYDETTNKEYWCPIENPTRSPSKNELKLKNLVHNT